MIRRFIAWLFGMPLVALRDFDGQEVLRLGRKAYFGDLYAHRMPFKIRPVWLCPGGVIKPDCYVREWTMVRDYRRDSGSRAERHAREDGHGPKDGRAADEVGIAQNPEPKQ